jgi:hypothetical protein
MSAAVVGVWLVIGVLITILIFVYPTNLGTKKMSIPTSGDAYVYGSTDNRYLPLGFGDPSRTVLLSGHKDGDIMSYLKFDLTSIPKSNSLENVDIDSAKLRLLVSSASGNQSKFFITANSCTDDNWSDTKITYDNRVCPDPKSFKGEDSIVVNTSALPQVSNWDVSNSVINATNNNQIQITYVITSFVISKDRDIADIISESESNKKSTAVSGGIVHFWPSEQSKLSDSAMPTLMINIVTNPKPVINYLTTGVTIALPILGAAFTLLLRQH